MWWRLMNINEIGNEPLELHKFFVQTFLISTILLFALAANMLDTSRFCIGCMIWQHAVILGSICATTRSKFSFQLNGIRNTFLLCTLLFLSSLLIFGLILLSPSPIFPLPLRTNFSKSKIVSSLCSSWIKFTVQLHSLQIDLRQYRFLC